MTCCASPGGLEPFRTAGAGVVGLQEVFGITEPELRAALAGAGLELTHWHAPAGLVLAHDPRVAAPVGDPLVTTLKAAGPLLRFSNHWHERAMLSAAFETAAGPVTVSTAHLIVFARAHARSKQVRALREALQQDRLRRGPHVLTGDMNHYPRPAAADRAMHEAGGFTHVPLHEPTWLHLRLEARVAGAARGRRHPPRPRELRCAARRRALSRPQAARLGTVFDVASDHRAVVCDFALEG